MLSAALLPSLLPAARAQYAPPVQREEPLPSGARRGWEFETTLAVGETYTDNVNLSVRGRERSDWVTQVRPGFTLSNYGPRTRLNLSYAPELVVRAKEGGRDVYHFLNGSGNAEVVRGLFYVDASAFVSQQNTTLLGPQADSNVSKTGNRTSVRTYSVSPYLRHDFGQQAQGELRYSRNVVEYSGNNVFNSEADLIDARIASGPAYRLLTWNAAYHKERIDYTGIQQSVELQNVNTSFKRLLTPTLSAVVNLGYEENNYATLGPSPEGAMWSVGPEWNPTPRTRLLATTGRRFFGPTHLLDFSHRTRLTTWRVNYTEDVTTARSQALLPTTVDTASYLDALFLQRIPDPDQRRAAVQSFVQQAGLPSALTAPVNYLTTVPFVQKRFMVSAAAQGVRNTVLASVYTQTRDVAAADAAVGALGSGDLAVSQRTRQTGASAVWTYRLTPFTTSTVSLDHMRNEFPAISREDTIVWLRASLTRQFQPRLSGSLTYRRVQAKSNVAGNDYRENAITVALNMRF